MDDPDVDNLLRASRPGFEFPQGFQRAVWSRIGVAGAPGGFSDFRLWFRRPLPLAAAAGLMVASGAALGRASLPDRPDGLAEYARAVSPVVAAQNHSP